MKSLIDQARKEQDAFRPRPFWSWNDELDPGRLCEQVRSMKQAGLGGFFMHARVGIKTPYQGEKWFDCIRASVKEARRLGMQPWGYDENGYPSGIADKKVVEENENWRSTWIELVEITKKQEAQYEPLAFYRFEGEEWTRVAVPAQATHVLYKKNEMRAADPLNKRAVERFIELTHERYKKELGDDFGENGMPGFFTDEPQLKQFQLPWSEGFAERFEARYGYDLLDKVFALKDDAVPACEAVRHDYWMLVHELYTLSFAETVDEWCKANGSRFTGHIMGEDTIIEQMGSTGGAMPFYEHMDTPGMDWLGRRIGSPLAPKQVSSVAAQTGKKQIISETFALSGWDVSFEDLKWMAEWQYANGINLLCPHLESYSIRGIRKRDYPASLFVQEPWWDSFAQFTDYISALGSLMGQMKEDISVLLVHPLHTAHVLFNGRSTCEAVRDLDASLLDVLHGLEYAHIGYHLGDEVVMGRHGAVEGTALRVGAMRYSAVLLPDMDNILSSTLALLTEFAAQGGKIYSCGRLPRLVDGRPSDVFSRFPVERIDIADFKSVLDPAGKLSVTEDGTECADILTSVREQDGTRLYFLANESRETAHTVKVRTAAGEALSLLKLPEYETVPLKPQYDEKGLYWETELVPAESAALIGREGACAETVSQKSPEKNFLALPETFEILRQDDNKLTLDACRYQVGDGPVEEKTPLIILQKRLLDAKTDDKLTLYFDFDLQTAELPAHLALVSENIPDFALTVNGHPVKVDDLTESYLDPDFKKVEIAPYLVKGQNLLVLTGRFWQRKELYDYLYRPKDLSSNYYAVDFDFESVTYDTEIESLYLCGDFTVEAATPVEDSRRRAMFCDAPFVIKDPVRTVKKGDITRQGYPFFAGRMTLGWTENLMPGREREWYLAMRKPVCPMALLSVNGSEPIVFSWGKCMPELSEYLKDGENRFELTLCSGLRNLLGPHHYKFGESYYVGTTTFANDPGWCEDVEGIHEPLWTDRWCFVQFGLFDK